jgi:dephospho-CoA kinase
MNKRKIVAVVGLAGGGKTEAINYLIEKLGWPKIYLGGATFEELQKRALPINEKNERLVREELREKNGPACYALWGIEKIKELEESANVLVESLYSWGEYLEFKKIFSDDFLVVAIYSSPKDRYLRLAKRPIRPLTGEEAQSRDYSQIVGLVAQAGPIAMADWTILNNASRENLFLQLDKIIEVLKK